MKSIWIDVPGLWGAATVQARFIEHLVQGTWKPAGLPRALEDGEGESVST